jgi:hypothetical protein
MSRSRPFLVSTVVALMVGCFPHYDFGVGQTEASGGGGASGAGASTAFSLTGGGSSTLANAGGAISSLGNGGRAETSQPAMGGSTGDTGQAQGASSGDTWAGSGGSTSELPSSVAGQSEVYGGTGGHSSGGSTSSGGASGGGNATNTGGNNTLPVPEVCGNGIDDDLDGKTDCDDLSDCPGLACVQSIPDGWNPVVVATGTPAADAPACDASSAYPTGLTLCMQVSTQPASCNCAECPMVSGATQALMLTVRSSCHGTLVTADPNDSTFVRTESCPLVSIDRSKFITTAKPFYVDFKVGFTDGQCSPSGFAANKDSAATGPECLQKLRVCRGSAPVGSCAGGGRTCLPKVPTRFTGMCVIKEGADLVCPSDWPKRFVARRYEDQRRCSDCTCTAPTEYYATAATLTNWSTNELCSGSDRQSSIHLGECLNSSNFDGTGSFKTHFQVGDVVSSQRCVSGGGDAIGSVTASEPYTICCSDN